MKIRITGIFDDRNLAKPIRINNPLSEIARDERFEIKLVNSPIITDEIASMSDVIYFNWSISNPNYEFSILKTKYPNLRIVIDIDDSNQYPVNHPIYRDVNKRVKSQQQQNSQIFEADGATVSTKPLRDDLIQYNSNITIIENFIEPKGQYVSNKTTSDKLRIGIYGSINSHFHDYLQLKQILNKLSKNTQIAEKCEFYILGYRPSPYWDEITKYFEVKKNLILHIVEGKPVDSYMQLLDLVDVVMIPLEDCLYNTRKSALKLLECSLSNTVAIGSKLYQDKEISSILVCEKPEDYLNTILYLLDKNNYKNVLNIQKSKNLADNDWQGRIEKLKNVFLNVYNKVDNSKLSGLSIFGITYEQYTQTTEYVKYDNSKIRSVRDKSYLFEYNPVMDILDNYSNDCEYLGILSWRFPEKTGLSKKALYTLLRANKYQDYDVINLTPSYKDLDPKNIGYYKWTEKIHPTWLEKFTKLCGFLGLSTEEPDQSRIIFSNMVVAKKEIYQKFVTDIVAEAIMILENEMKEEAFENSKYINKLGEEKLEELTGLPYYTFHTFLLERLWSAYLMTNKELKILKFL